MEFIFELLFGLFFEVPIEATMESKRVKTWVKTAIFLILFGILDVVMVVATWLMVIGQSWGEAVICGLIALFFITLTVWGAINGRKRNWKNTY